MRTQTIGILGGMGPEATLLFFQKILSNTNAVKDQDHARLIIYNDPKIPERLPAIEGKGENPLPMMIQGLLSLKRAGADLAVIPCVTAHYFLPQMEGKRILPLISIIEATISHIKKNYAFINCVGLMAALGTIRTGLFQRELAKKKISTLISEESDLQKVQNNIFAIKNTTLSDRKKIKRELIKIGEKLIKKGAQGIIIGCTELPIVLTPDCFDVPAFDVLDILARAALRKARVKVIP
ncbi:MAG: aspartate/glutamate racemase family protein [Thermodesulfobacteriota bacterium]